MGTRDVHRRWLRWRVRTLVEDAQGGEVGPVADVKEQNGVVHHHQVQVVRAAQSRESQSAPRERERRRISVRSPKPPRGAALEQASAAAARGCAPLGDDHLILLGHELVQHAAVLQRRELLPQLGCFYERRRARRYDTTHQRQQAVRGRCVCADGAGGAARGGSGRAAAGIAARVAAQRASDAALHGGLDQVLAAHRLRHGEPAARART
jgi:hypothetical protein